MGVVELANCPKCDYKLKLTDWKPECPKCGTNVLYYNFEEQFYIDAKGAEIDAAKIRVKWTRVKTAFIGSKLLVARLSLSILPLIATLLSIGSFKIAIPLFEKNVSFSTIGLFSVFTDGTFNYLTALKNSVIVGEYARHTVNIFFGLSAVVGLALLVLLFQFLCFISIKKMTIVLTTASTLGIIAAVWSMFAVNNFSNAASSEIFTVGNGFGGYVIILSFAVILTLNFIIAKKGVGINYLEGDLYRVEIAKKLKRKEITFDQISQPVYTSGAKSEEPVKESAVAEGVAENG